tara:strand:+ start:584 stop:1099 length:516 start_codon:yes stop_codon:yes gene_type:complete
MTQEQIIPIEFITNKILLIRKQKVILDRDLAKLYGVSTSRLNEQVTRNRERFPKDFMFRLSENEFKNLKSQYATSSWGGVRKCPRVFTEHGVAMLSSVLRSKKAIEINILIMRAFVKMRELFLLDKELAQKVEKLEKQINSQGKSLSQVIQILNKLMQTPKSKTGKIGFKI